MPGRLNISVVLQLVVTSVIKILREDLVSYTHAFGKMGLKS